MVCKFKQYFIYIVIPDRIVFITKSCLEFTLNLVVAGNVIQYFNGNEHGLHRWV